MKKVSHTKWKVQSLCVQPTFIIGTYNEDNTPNFAPITWVSITYDNDQFYIILNMNGSKKTKENAARLSQVSVNLASVDMLELVDYFGAHRGIDGLKNKINYDYEEGQSVHAPILDVSRWVYECEISQTVYMGETTTYFCAIKNVQVIESMKDVESIDLTLLDPIVYSGDYFSINKRLGTIGDFYKDKK